MARILVTEKIAPAGLERLRRAGHDVDEQLELSHEQLLDAVRGAHALIVRSATQVTADVIAAGVGLVAVGRAGVGVDNVDVEAATRQGVMVVNAPHSNTVSTAEHTMAMLLAQARNVPQAAAALREGRWERSKWTGIELADKTLGIIGLGRIGALVAARADAFQMRVVAYDPFVAPDRAKRMGVELLSLEELMATSDFVTLHLTKTADTVNLIDAELLAKAKPGLRIVNVARGGIINETDLAAAVDSGHLGGAAIDVFAEEPTTSSPLFGLANVVVTPHLGASTREAQDKAGEVIGEQIELALAGDFVPFAVNLAAKDANEILRPFLPLSEQLGRLFAGLFEDLPDKIDLEFAGDIGGYDNTINELAVAKGLLAAHSDGPVSYVNALDLAKDRGLRISVSTTAAAKDHVNTITIRGGGRAIAGTLHGLRGDARIVMVDDHTVDLPPAPHMIVLRNDDRPGVIGRVGTLLGDAEVNIAGMNVGRNADDKGALMLISTSNKVPEQVADGLAKLDGITECVTIDLE